MRTSGGGARGGAGGGETRGEVAQAGLARAARHERELAADGKNAAAVGSEFGDGGEGGAVLEGERTRIGLGVDHGADKVWGGELADSRVLLVLGKTGS